MDQVNCPRAISATISPANAQTPVPARAATPPLALASIPSQFAEWKLPSSRVSAGSRTMPRRGPDFPVITPHDLRHTAASLAVSAGAHVKAVQRMLGHASAAMTLDVYAYLFDDDLNQVAAALDARAGAAVAKMWPNA